MKRSPIILLLLVSALLIGIAINLETDRILSIHNLNCLIGALYSGALFYTIVRYNANHFEINKSLRNYRLLIGCLVLAVLLTYFFISALIFSPAVNIGQYIGMVGNIALSIGIFSVVTVKPKAG